MGDKKFFAAAVIAVAALLWLALALLGGPLNSLDQAAIGALAAQRAIHPALTHAGVWVSFAGSAPATLGLAVVLAGFLLWRSRRAKAIAVIAIVLSGRLIVEILKLLIGRPRPDLDLHAVNIQSLSFPSGHAANSMIAFVAIALFASPEKHRKAALAVAVTASLIVGATRPLLGVHWPSDVLAGWAFGLLWAVCGWQIAGRFGRARSA